MIHLTGKASDFLKIGVKAAERGQLEQVKQILDQKPHWLHKVGSHGRTMLWEACHKGRLEVVQYLVEQGANIQACGSHYTPYFVEVSCLAIALHRRRMPVAVYLESKGAYLDIHNAAFVGQYDLVRNLLEAASNRINRGYPQHIMAPKNQEDIDFTPADTPWATPLCYALRGGDVATVSYLIKKGASIRPFSKQLFIAADDEPTMVRLLLENGADPDFAPRALPDNQALFQVVSAHGVPLPSQEELSGHLVYLCRGDNGGNVEEVLRLLEHGADINYQDKKGKTALHRAAKAGFTATIQVLLEHEADLERSDLSGETPIFEPIRSTIKDQHRRQQALALLLRWGPNPAHPNDQGHTPMEVLSRSKGGSKKTLLELLTTYRK